MSCSRVVCVGLVAAAVVGVCSCNKKSTGGAKKTDPNPPPTVIYAPPPELAAYWRRPIALQGPGRGNSAIENSLLPKNCGVCHPAQLALWQGSRHASATGPGFHAQILEQLAKNTPNLTSCARCHFPLTEQYKVVDRTRQPNPSYDAELYKAGLTCAACHVRGWVVNGPKGRNPPMENAPHNGYVVKPFFQKSEFCATCHQFVKGELSLAGKYLENTYLEWKQSRYAKEGKQCQGCHMPDRKHMWRGIHDKQMTRSGLTIALKGKMNAPVVTLTSSGVGHMFPTYVTAAVYVRFVQLNKAGEPLATTKLQYRIQRRVPVNLKREHEDTRIPPGETRSFAYTIERRPDAAKIKIEIEVDPDEFYRRFYQVSLKPRAKMDPAVVRQYELALAETFTNKYILWSKEISLR